MENLEKEIAEIITRNKRVELDKAWETSITRRYYMYFNLYSCNCLFIRSKKL